MLPMLLSVAWLAASCTFATASFNLSNTLGDGMVLQRGPQSAVVWGFGTPGIEITTTFKGTALPPAVVQSDGVWRQALPPTDASKVPTTIAFSGSDGGKAQLADVLFGDVFLCSGQYTPHSMAGMNNLTAELAAADSYADSIRFFTVGMETVCGDPKRNQTNCTLPFRELNPAFTAPHPCSAGHSCRENWEPASAKALGGNGTSWNTFSAVCWLTGRNIHDALGGTVPIGLISSNWGGTPVQVWTPGPGGVLYNSMIAPYTVGPMALKGATWYQGESNVGAAAFYSVAFPEMITQWRTALKNPALWFGFVQIAGFGYSHPWGNPPQPEVDHSHAAGDLRQAQLAALALDNVGMTTAIDTGDWSNIHPPDKQNPSRRLANQALEQIYGMTIPGASFPLYSGSSVATTSGTVTVTVQITAGGKPARLTDQAPLSATQSSTLGAPGSIPRNQCVTAGIKSTFPQDCGYPAIYGTLSNGTVAILNATATIGSDPGSILLTATGVPEGFTPEASAYGRASWPRTVFFSADPGNLPVIPWFANFSTKNCWTPPVLGGVGQVKSRTNDVASLFKSWLAQ